MCFSAIVEQDLARLKREFKAKPDLRAFKKLFERRAEGAPLLLPKAMEANFYNPDSPEAEEIAGLIEIYHGNRARLLEAELFKQRTRMVKAERALQTHQVQQTLWTQPPAKIGLIEKLLNEQRIASNKVSSIQAWIADLKRRTPERRDSRVFQFSYAPIVLIEDGERIIRPMRYLLRRAGRPVSDDEKFKGCYNARRDNLTRFWKHQFGFTHGIAVVTSFYENVARHAMEHRELAAGEKAENVILRFDPKPEFRMWIACLVSHWTEAEQPDLWSFAAVTDEPPPEIAAAGHDRCIIPIKEQHLEAWLAPEERPQTELFQIFDDREQPYYEHRVAA